MELLTIFTERKLTQEEQDFVNGLIEAEKVRGIAETGKKGKELNKIMGERNKLRDLLRTHFEVDPESADLEAELTAAKEKLQKAVKTGDATEIDKLRKDYDKKLADMKTIVDTERAEKETVKKANRRSKMTDVLSKAFGGRDKVPSMDYVISGLIADGTVKALDDGKDTLVFVLPSGEEVPVDKGVVSFLKDRPELLKNTQTPGSGGGGGTGVIKSPDGKERMKTGDWEKLPPKEKAKWINDPNHELIHEEA